MTGFFVIVGQITVSVLFSLLVMAVLEILREAARAGKQVFRILRAHYGHSWRTKLSMRSFARRWWSEFFSGYTSICIGGIILPHNPWAPVQRRNWA